MKYLPKFLVISPALKAGTLGSLDFSIRRKKMDFRQHRPELLYLLTDVFHADGPAFVVMWYQAYHFTDWTLIGGSVLAQSHCKIHNLCNVCWLMDKWDMTSAAKDNQNRKHFLFSIPEQTLEQPARYSLCPVYSGKVTFFSTVWPRSNLSLTFQHK